MASVRTRFHVNKKTPFGYGDNPDNVFLITIDEVTVYPADGSFEPLGNFSEIEIDFERNTFFRLFDSVYTDGNDANKGILASFEEDQKTLKSLIASKLSEMGYPPETEGMETKFSKALRASESK